MMRYWNDIRWALRVMWMEMAMTAARFCYWNEWVRATNWFLQKDYSLMEVDGELIRVGHERL